MAVTWILAANRSRARVLEIRTDDTTPRECADFANPSARAHERDLESDAAGRFFGGEREQGHGASGGENAGDHETDRFVIDLRNFLEHARTEKRYDHLWVVAAPAVLGLLRKAFSKPLRQHVEVEIDKDVTTEKPGEIVRYVREERKRRRELGKL